VQQLLEDVLESLAVAAFFYGLLLLGNEPQPAAIPIASAGVYFLGTRYRRRLESRRPLPLPVRPFYDLSSPQSRRG
jgi:hypothetical protein